MSPRKKFALDGRLIWQGPLPPASEIERLSLSYDFSYALEREFVDSVQEDGTVVNLASWEYPLDKEI